MATTHRISRLDAAQTAKVMGALYFLFGIVFAAIFGLFAMGMSASMADEGAFMFSGIFIVLMPVMYGVMGVISGLLISVFYNLVAGFTGGLEVELT